MEESKYDLTNLSLHDAEGHLYVFYNEDEALIYATMLQNLYPDIWFCRIHTSFSVNGGKFYTIEAIAKDKEKPSEFKIVPDEIMIEIVKQLKSIKDKETGIVKPELKEVNNEKD